MKVRNTFKRVAAIGMGASMLGATIMGAVAEDLANYPSPLFIQDGMFNGVIVLGDTAISSDTLGAIDIATGLQYSATTGVGGSGTGFTISEGAKIQKSGNKLNINESINTVTTKLDETDLPELLKAGIYDDTRGNSRNRVDYRQELGFNAGANKGQLLLHQHDKDAPSGGLYISFGDGNGEIMYNYSLEFDSVVDYDNTSLTTARTDLEGTAISIQGNVYTVTDLKLHSNNTISELTLQAGETTLWLEEGQAITRVIEGNEHEITLVGVSTNADKCGVMVDGTLQWIDTSSSKKINGIEVGVIDAITVHTESRDTDVCEVNIGATEIILKHDSRVKINSADIDGSKVIFTETTSGEFEKINIWFIPEDDIYLSAGQNVVDPVLGNFKFSFAGVTDTPNTEISLDVSGDDMELNFLNVDGDAMSLPFFCAGSCDATSEILYFGTSADIDERYFFRGGACIGTTSVTDCEGAKFLVTQGDALKVIEIDDIDSTNNETVLKDVNTGATRTSRNKLDGTSQSYDIPGGTVLLNINPAPAANSTTFVGTSGDAIVAVGGQWETQHEGLLSLTGFNHNGTQVTTNASGTAMGNSNVSIIFNETNGNVDSTSEANHVLNQVEFYIDIDTTDEEFRVAAPNFTTANTQSAVDVNEANSDDQIYYTNYGTKILFDNKEKREATLWFPEDELYANLFVAPVSATVRSTSTGGAVSLQRIEVGTARLASEVGAFTQQNTIIVGGPCANAKAAEFLGVSQAECMDAAPEVNTAVIALKEYGDRVALLVNGRDALDTRRAARVLANYQDYDLSGSEVVVTGTDFTNIQVSTV